MYCKNCGALIDDNSKFCNSCGLKLDESETNMPAIIDNFEKIKSKSKKISFDKLITKIKRHKKIICILAAVVIVIVAVSCAAISNGNKIAVANYINPTIEYQGYDGYATIKTSKSIFSSNNAASVIYDYSALSGAISDKAGGCSLVSMTSWPLEECITAEFAEDYKDLSNGDKVTAIITVDYDTLNDKLPDKAKLKGKKKIKYEYEVYGLKEPATVDPFELADKIFYDSENNELRVLNSQKSDENTDKNYSVYVDSAVGYLNENKYNIETRESSNFCNYHFALPDDYKNDGTTQKVKVKVVASDDEKENKKDIFSNQGVIFSTMEKEIEVPVLTSISSKEQAQNADYTAAVNYFKSQDMMPDECYYVEEELNLFGTDPQYIIFVKNNNDGCDIISFSSCLITSDNEFFIDSDDVNVDTQSSFEDYKDSLLSLYGGSYTKIDVL